MTYFHVRHLTWDGEAVQHFQPYSHPVVPHAPMLCGTRLPPFEGSPRDDKPITKPLCRRCGRAYWKIWRRKRTDFEKSVQTDLDQIPTLD